MFFSFFDCAFPQFKDVSIEAAWRAHLASDRRANGKWVILALFLLQCLYCLYVMVGGMTTESSIHRFAAVGLAGFFAVCGVFSIVSKQQVGTWFEGVVLLGLMGAAILFTLTPDRWAKLIQLSDDQWSPHFLMEGQCVALVCSVLNLAAIVAELSPIRCLFLVHYTVLVYLVITWRFDSLEYRIMADKYGYSYSQTVRFVMVSIQIYIVGICGYLARRRREMYDRSQFGKTALLRQQLSKQHDEMQELQARQKELQAMTRALESGETLDRSSVSHAKQPIIQKPKVDSDDHRLKTVPLDLVFGQVDDSVHASSGGASMEPNEHLVRCMRGKTADWPRIRSMAERIREEEYSLHDFFHDCVKSFPELSIFQHDAAGSTSGRGPGEEYQRTIGALFAVYWLLRLDTDGRQSFCFGVDENFMPLNDEVAVTSSLTSARSIKQAESVQSWKVQLFTQMTNENKRRCFLETMEWQSFEKLVYEAGCAENQPNSTERVMSLLCLTAFHDVMKVEDFLPVVSKQHDGYQGFAAGTRLIDHDIALAYVLEHYQDLLPSYAGLPEHQQNSVLFTQGKMRFNHGWFVQAEAPPGVMLSQFKSVVSSNASSADVGLYFLHWFTDLAGAEATPMGGCEKFVLKFPHKVLASFLWSMPVLGRLAAESETTVVEEYLAARWQATLVGRPAPTDPYAIARMRLLVMSQGSPLVIDAFNELSGLIQAFLADELQRTGIRGQTYSCKTCTDGPAFLVYYGPALLQRAASSLLAMSTALRVLAVLLRASRQLWPASKDKDDSSVTIHIGELKAMDIDDVVQCPGSPSKVWALVRQSDHEGVVSMWRASDLNWLVPGSKKCRALCFDEDACEEDFSLNATIVDV